MYRSFLVLVNENHQSYVRMTCANFSGALCRLSLPNQLLLLVFVYGGEMNKKEEMEEVLSRKNVCFRGGGSSVQLFSSGDTILVDIKGLVKFDEPSQQCGLKVRYLKDRLFQDSSLIVRNVKDHTPQLVFKPEQSAESLTVVTLAPLMETLETQAEDSCLSRKRERAYEKNGKRHRKTFAKDCDRKRRRVTDVEMGRESEDGPKTKGRQEANPKQGPSISEEREESINLRVKKGNPENDELELLANDINPEDWKKVARKLKIDDPKITAIHKENEECYEKIYTMLRKWKQKNGRAATWEKLHQALVGAELGELAEKHCCEKVN
ncbi:uncharacterized protein LOC111345451 [Stylophora pistillata]|uniref:uncharacterized protein LOC111345451 n=1 Tax=Stylophora pistillata TaxID=50429 RepID=UPI000C0552AB|nr:uncharacterized protein LOC111345451 [Stylophora pistillata]XP_022808465.1 uncharacterized protein LOC111345451 [Stylophora pistillata]